MSKVNELSPTMSSVRAACRYKAKIVNKGVQLVILLAERTHANSLSYLTMLLCHSAELGNTAPKEPFFFIKPTTSYLANNGTVELPQGINVHHEVELGVIIGKKARDVSEKDAMSHVAGYALAIDMSVSFTAPRP